ncbi:zeta toxin family protein [Microbacterium aerolatum]|uniref:zeta toxin family protein n=1 Tax=Microbacterium aerolatum TaxID=153731 RepID=UPI002001010F|nr:zeta toxin family protein [Microbacterium aerolatum]MCK3769406.1 zeta toxin family protein [Microbacterium aerolatum]
MDREAIVLRSVFNGARPTPHPTFVLLAGSLGAGTGRAIALLREMHGGDLVPIASEDLQAFHPRYLEPRFRASAAGQKELSQAAANWLQASITYARESRYSLLLEGAFRSPRTALAVAHRFADSGYQVHVVVVAARGEENLLSATSRGLWQMQQRLPSHFVTPAKSERSLADVDALVAASAGDSIVERVSVIGRRGQTVLDAHRSDPAGMADVSAAFRASCAERMSALEATQWLSELRHMTEYARSLRAIPNEAMESLIELHDMAIRRVVAELPVPPESEVVRIQQEKLVADLAVLRRAHEVSGVVDAAAPIVTPTASGPSTSRGVDRAPAPAG